MAHCGKIAAAFNPTDKHQEKAVRRLAGKGRANHVRSLPNGSVELLVEIGGAYRAYLVDSDGSATVTVDGQPTDRYRRSERFILVGIIMFVGLGLVSFALHRDGSIPDALGYPMVGGFGLIIVGCVLQSRHAEPPVEVSGWDRIDFSD